MAGISVYAKTSTSLTLRLISLDTTWQDGIRTVNWYIGSANGGIPTESAYYKSITGGSLENGASVSNTVKFTGLTADTTYGILCTVYHGTTLLASVKGWATTEEKTESLWNGWQMEVIEISTYEQSVSISLSDYEVYRYTVIFSYSGYAHFYTTGQLDTIGFLSDDYEWNSDNSGPLNEIASDDDSGEDYNFDIKYYVTAGVEYNIFVRGRTGKENGDCTLCITEPWQLNSLNYGTISENKTESISVKPLTLYRRTLYFSKKGTLNAYTTGTLDTIGWLSTSSEWDKGKPVSFLKKDDESGEDSNFLFSYEVEANTTYYLYAKSYYASDSGVVTLNVSFTEKSVTISKWDWYSSNGSATSSETSKAYTAVLNKTAVNNFSYLVWNDLVDKVKQIIDGTNDSWDSKYLTYAGTKMTASNKTLSALKFNSLRYNIGSHYSTGISEVSSGNDVKGSYFITLALCINKWIDGL